MKHNKSRGSAAQAQNCAQLLSRRWGDADGGHMCVGWRQVACTEREFDLNELKVQPHRPMLEAMASSVFCLILPGNSQSSQRLTEAFLTGCIPVFLGPPWHTLPFAHEARPLCLCLYANTVCLLHSMLLSIRLLCAGSSFIA